MSLLTSQARIPFAGILGLVLRHNPPFIHVGFVYRTKDDSIVLSHLGWHHAFYGAGELEDQYLWLDSLLDPEICEMIAEYLELVASEFENETIPYGIVYPVDPFGEGTVYRARNDGEGLTCATYVVAIMERMRQPVLDASTWPTGRADDIKWAELILSMLEKRKDIKPEHVEIQRKVLPFVTRLRPEEVAAAFVVTPARAEYFPQPAEFVEIESTSIAIANEVRDSKD